LCVFLAQPKSCIFLNNHHILFLDELRWRGLLADCTPDLEAAIAKGEVTTAYVGFDPTAPSLTIGNLVPLTLLIHWQRAGLKPIVLLGGATGRIGDPSGKNAERELKSFDELDKNLAHQAKQFEQYLAFDGDNAAIIVNNHDFYKSMNVLTFLRDVGKRLTINYMLAKDSVKNRIETGMSFTEFSYQLIQGYDYQYLLENNGCSLQMGGSDQWGNIMSGVELVRRNLGRSVHALTCKLLTKADGTKYGKSEAGNIWLDAALTSPYQFYQFFLNSADGDITKLLRTFSLKTRAEIESIEATHAAAPHARTAQRALADELTVRVHSPAALAAAVRVSELLFSKDAATMQCLTANDWATVAAEIPSFSASENDINEGVTLENLLTKLTTIAKSNSDVRRDAKAGAISINREKATEHNQIFNTSNTLFGKYILVEIGKKNKYLVCVE
jgi:tyrosyl-tRNA synthetase